MLTSLAVAADKDVARRLDEAAGILSEVIDSDKGIPRDLLDRSHCAIVVPSLKKGAFVVGAQYGKGFMTCRKSGGGWGAPLAIKVEGGSVGFQIGGSETELVMLVMNARAIDELMSSKFTLGGEGEVAAGPVGRTASAQTDLKMTAEILSWSRSRGVFAGVSLKGATLRPDDSENKDLYGKTIDSRDIVKNTPAPPAAGRLLALLNKYSPAEKKS
jgi:lipid-binding SYLF domain-containing protein